MTALYIIGGILLFLLLLSLLKITLRIRAGDEFALTLFLGIILVRLAPKKEKPIRLSDYGIAKYRKKRLKEEKKRLKNERKKTKKNNAEPSTVNEPSEKAVSETLSDLVDLIKYVVADTVKKFGKYLKVRIDSLKIVVSSDDTAKTAVTFGYVSQAVSFICSLLNTVKNVTSSGRDDTIGVYADFISEKSRADVDISASIRIWQLLSVGFTALYGFIKMPGKSKNKKKSAQIAGRNKQCQKTKSVK